MSTSSESDSKEQEAAQAQRDLETIRQIITEKSLEKERAERRARAREEVSQVFTEALNDRQQKDNSVSQVISPIIERSMQRSMQSYREQFTDYLYPLVGELARKFTIQILRDFVEKTNEVIENSLSLRSLSWRVKAWRAGVNYTHYVASQTFVFQINQVLLIHKKTGILLNSASKSIKYDENSDLVSAMLSAINDFVSDSFSNSTQTNEQQLDEIKTDEFTLYIKQGPQAILVAAVTGVIAPKAKMKLQATLEQIHNLYLPQLAAFEGDTKAFITTQEYLHDCLLSEHKPEHNHNKKPIFGLTFVLLIACYLAYLGVIRYQSYDALHKIETLPQNQGITLTKGSVEGNKDIHLTLLRDPNAPNVDDWLSNNNINKSWLTITEVPFVSLAPEVIINKIGNLIAQYPSLTFDPNRLEIGGDLQASDNFTLLDKLNKIPGIETIALSNNIRVNKVSQANTEAEQIAMNTVAGEVSQLQINFTLASSEINKSEQAKLLRLVNKFKQLKAYAALNGQDVKLLILGTSDNIGDPEVNRTLSMERAHNTQQALLELGIASEDTMVSGLGIVEVSNTNTNIRKAIINVVYNPL